MMQENRRPSEVVASIAEYVSKLPGELGLAVGAMKAAEEGQDRGGSHRVAEPNRLLPIRREAVEKYCERLGVEVQRWVLLSVDALNFMYLGGQKKIGGEILSEPQRKTLEMIIDNVEFFMTHETPLKSKEHLQYDLGRVRFDYSGEPVAIMEELEAASVIACWPKPGEAGIQPAAKFVKEEVREWLESPNKTLLPRCYWPTKPPKSRVRATDKEWELIVEAAVARNMMREVSEDEILRDQEGRMVLNGAGAVPKYKIIGGEEKKLQRFISILVPSNSYQDHMPGDDRHLPYVGQISMLQLEEGENLIVDSEDLTSCFNLFELPPEWGGMMTFSKQVSSKVFGGPAGKMSWVAMKVVPMGWINSVSLMQSVVRTLVFEESDIPVTSEISKMKRFPEDTSASLVYLDSYDELRKIQKEATSILQGESSDRHKRFTATCNRFGLALNEGKRLLGSLVGNLQGGMIDGERGTFAASPDKLSSLVGYGAMLLSLDQVSEFELRHFTGKALFAMAFRRPAMSIIEALFHEIERAKAARRRIELAPKAKDEIVMILALIPLLRMNIRAPLDDEVTITDASPMGAGGGVATTFKREPDTEDHEGTECFHCQGAFENGRYPCPASCRVALCSVECQWRHRNGPCKRRGYPVPKFGERFSGAKAPLTDAVAKVGLLEVQQPYDLKTGFDFFTDDGRAALEELEGDPHLFAEHYAPCCKLFSRARGRPVRLPDGRTIPGPQPVRDHANLMGFKWLSKDMKQRLRHSNTMANRGISRLRKAKAAGRIGTMEHPYNSWLWYWKGITELQEEGFDYAAGSMCCFGGRREKWFALLGNSDLIQAEVNMPECPGHRGLLSYEVHYNDQGQLVFDTEEESQYPYGWCEKYALGLRKEVERSGLHHEGRYEGRRLWVLDQLSQSTERLKEESAANNLAGDITYLEMTMQHGQEAAHLKEMIRRLAIRGAELKLMYHDGAEEMPYPAYRWYFRKVFSFRWKQDLHINIGELNSFNTMAERRSAHPSKHGSRYMAILDSQVVRGAVGKGRSSSKPMNRGLRKTAALLIASDAYPLLAWTISAWNWADQPSRVFTWQKERTCGLLGCNEEV